MAGPFYLAYIDEDETFNPSVHNVEDEQIHSFTIEQEEGEFASLEIELENPRVGALAPGKQQWVFFSWDRAWRPSGSWTPNIILLFKGRVLATPSNLQEEIIQMTFIARPSDYEDQKAALADSLKERPYWDPIWFDPDKLDDPDNVLESRPAHLHIDRRTLEVTISHILNGEDGTVSLNEDQIFFDDTSVEYGEVPLRTVNMTASVSWEQAGSGAFDISKAFEFGGSGTVYTYTGPGLRDNWPKSGHSLGNGWKVDQGECLGDAPEPVWGYRYNSEPIINIYNNGVLFSFDPAIQESIRFMNQFGPEAIRVVSPPWYENVQPLLTSTFITKLVLIPRWHMLPVMTVRFEVNRKYSELLTISLSADVQDIRTDTAGADTLDLTMSSSELASPIDPYGDIPIGDVRRRTFFSTDRGEQAIEYLIALMRARLLARARCVDITFQTTFQTAIDLDVTLRKDLVADDSRFPDGIVGGKIIHYRLSLDGNEGTMLAEIKIGGTVGRNGAIAAVPGVGVYASAGYMAHGYQREVGAHVVPFASDVAYVPINGLGANDDGVDLLTLNSDNVIKSLVKENGADAQKAALDAIHSFENPSDAFTALNEVPTRFTLTMLPVTGGPFQTSFVVLTTDLKIPRTVNLEAGYV
jgi:hypothetical protein